MGQYLYDFAAVTIPLAYSTSDIWFARTPGKMLLRLVIAFPDGAAADRWTLSLRWSTKYFGYLLSLIEVAAMTPAGLVFLADSRAS